MKLFHRLLIDANKTLLLLCLAVPAMSVYALDLATAKAQGLVGESNNGYLGYVVTPVSDEVKSLVEQVNSKRKAVFIKAAKNNKITTKQVAQRFYERAVMATVKDRYYQDATGKWIKK